MGHCQTKTYHEKEWSAKQSRVYAATILGRIFRVEEGTEIARHNDSITIYDIIAKPDAGEGQSEMISTDQ